MRLLDLFCGAGGAARGYHDAGFDDITGVDNRPQPRYPYRFVLADALEYLREHGREFDVIHASPPCQDHSVLYRNYHAPLHGTGSLLVHTISVLRRLRVPWVVENVVGAPLSHPVELCGASFGLGASGLDLNRHRLFQASFVLLAPPCQHRQGKTIGVYGNGTNRWHRAKLGRCLRIAEMREAMRIDWMDRASLSQAIPPAYTEFIGKQLMAALVTR